MLDRWTIQLVRRPLELVAVRLKAYGCTPDQVTCTAFVIGILAMPALYLQLYWPALVCILLNRFGDGLDGALARMTRVTDGGGFLDIVLDFIFYASVVLGFALADPFANGLAAALLLFSFIGTGSTFLAFAVMAERRGMTNIVYPQKGIYYLAGLAEGTETMIFFTLFCLLPEHFPLLAAVFTTLCLVTVATRIIGGYLALR